MGIVENGAVCLMVHSGSRGLGYQVCDDSLQVDFRKAPAKYGISSARPPACLRPGRKPRGTASIFGAMRAAANYAWANRQLLMWQARESLRRAVFGRELGIARSMRLVYDVAHNIAKMEEHTVGGVKKTVCVHRKGATRAFPTGSSRSPPISYRRDRPAGDHSRATWVGRVGCSWGSRAAWT